MEIKIRQFNRKGSEVTTYNVVEEAQKVLDDYRRKGYLIVDETTDAEVKPGEALQERTYGVVPRIQGG